MKNSRTLALAVLLASTLSAPVGAQTSPNLIFGQVLTPAQWNALFASKQDFLGAPPIIVTGGTMTGKLVTAPSSTLAAGFNIPAGAAPTIPVDGDIWETTAGTFVRSNGVTVGPLLGGSSGTFTGTSPIVPSFPSAGVVNYAFDLTVANTFLALQTDQGATTTQPGWYAQITGDTAARIRIGPNSVDVPAVSFGPGNAARDLHLERAGPASLRFGSADAAAPIAQTFNVQNVLAGTSNTAGANLTINGSIGTGTGAGGSIIFQVAPAGSTGSTQNALSNALTLSGAKLATFGGHVSIEGVTSTGATGTNALVFGTSPTLATPVINGLSTGTGVATANTASTLVARDGSGNFSAGTVTASLVGHSSLDLALTGGTMSGAIAMGSNSITGAAAFTANAAGQFNFTGQSSIQSPSDGVLELLNNAGTGFTRLQFGGTTSSFPAIKRTTTALNARLADDSADATITFKTQTPGDNTTNGATTAFVTAAVVASTTGVSSIAGNTGAFTLGGLLTNNVNVLQVLSAAKSDMQTATSTTTAVTPAQTQNHPGVAKMTAFVTYSGATPTLAQGYNVASISALGTGSLQIVFITSFANTTYACSASAQDSAVNTGDTTVVTRNAGNLTVNHYEAGTAANPANISVICFGSQ